jgi:hypothetical protein
VILHDRPLLFSILALLVALALIFSASQLSKRNAQPAQPDPVAMRERADELLEAAERIRSYYRIHGRWPTTFSELKLDRFTPYDPFIGSIALNDQGGIEIVMAQPQELAGRRIEIVFRLRNGFWYWECQADPAIPAAWLPERCQGASVAATAAAGL